MLFGKLQAGCHVPFTEEWLPSGHYHKGLSAAEMVVLLEGSPISTEELFSYHRVLGHLPDQGPSPLIAQFAPAASSRNSLGGSKLISFKSDGGRCIFGDFQCCRHFLVPFPRSVPRHNPVSELYGQFLRPHGLVISLTCTVNCGTLYRQCVPFQIISNQLNLPQVDFNQVVETSQGWSMETGCT